MNIPMDPIQLKRMKMLSYGNCVAEAEEIEIEERGTENGSLL